MHIFNAEMTRKNVIGPCFLLLMTCFSIAQSDCAKPTFTIHTILDLDLPVYDLGESINVSCPENHAFFQEVHRDEPFVIITCLSHTWNTSQIPNCGSLYSDVTEVADCADLGPDPIPPSAGNRSLLVGNGTSYLSVYRYFCEDGYAISSAPIVQCRGTWDQLPDDLTQPTCEKLTCRLPDSTPVLSFSSDMTTLEVDMSVTVVCAPGFQVRGQAVITCTPYARLNSTPACEDVNECSSSPSPCDHICFNTLGSYRCQCNVGYHLAEDETTCEDDDECTAYPTLCPDGTCQNEDGSYTCSCDSSLGYVLFTEDALEGVVIPESEKLLDSINNTLRINHTCVPRQCASPDLPNGYLLNPQPTFHVGDTQSFDCKLGYVLMGDNTITCMPNGDWSAQIPQCETAFCGNVTFGEVVSESCNGLDVQRTCIYNRDTDTYTLGLDSPFVCPDIMCEPEPSEVDVGNGYLQFSSGNEGSVGSEYRIVCNSSANLTGSTPATPGDVVTCGVDGRWTLGTAYCLDQCEDAVCAMNGVCVENGTDTLCACPFGETIEDCNSPVDPCGNSPCPNNTAQCQPLGSVRRVCICEAGWTGENCETDIDECSSKPCLNGAGCEDGIDSYTCTCLDGYEGPQCQSTSVCPPDIECPGCMANYREGGVLCRCPRGYRTNDTVDRSGRWWENLESVSTGCIPEDPCANDPCLNGATCSPASAESREGSALYNCSCGPGFTGQRCQIETDECVSSPCRNGGTCVDLHNGFMCRCLNNTGSYLSSDCILGCESDPCSPDGTSSRGCQDSFDDYYCPCEDGFTGKDCEMDIDDCTPSPCLHGGLCTDGTNSFTCTCQAGWEGLTCNQVTSSCSPTACMGNATCIDLFNDYFCLCEDMTRTDCDARFSICDNGDACYGDSVCVDGGCDCSAASPSRVGDRCFLVQDQCATGCRVNDLCRTGHGDFVCGTRGQEPKQLFLTKSVPMNWINTHVNFACTDVCQEVITALEPKLGTTRYVGAAPSADNRITVVIENFGFVSQTSEIQTELRDLSLTVLPIDIYGVGFEAVRPGFGPQAGGTLITITGYNLLEEFTVLIGEINCPVVMSNRVVIICSTSELVDTSQLGSTLSMYVVGSERLYTGHKFTYRGNPTISSVMPLRTIMSGGIPLVVEGTNLDSVHQPLMITTVRRNNGGTETTFETVCTVISASTLNCPTPDITSAVQQRRKRHVSMHKARVRRQGNVAEDVTITIGFQFDGLLDFMDLTANDDLAQYGMITPHDNPEISTFDEEDGTLTFRSTWPFSERQIQIMGSRLAPAVTPESVTVRVGLALCTVEDVQPDVIVCAPPVNRPEVAASQFREDGRIPVQVKIGNLNFEAGHVIYIQNIWEYLPARIGIIVAIVVFALLVIILAVCCYRKHRQEYPDFPDISESPRRPIVFRRHMTLISRQGRHYGSTHSVGIFRRSQHHVRSISRRLGTGEYGSEIFY